MRFPQSLYAATVAIWASVVAGHAAWWFVLVLPNTPPSPDLYANNVGFQIMAYLLVWLAPAVVVLILVLLVEFTLVGRRRGSNGKHSS